MPKLYFVIFIVIALSIYSAMHWFVYQRIAAGLALSVGQRLALKIVMLAGASSFILAEFVSRQKPIYLLRLAGFDSLYDNQWEDRTLSRLSRQEGRILLTRDRGLLMRSEVTHGYCVRSPHPPAQLSEVIARFDLSRRLSPFSLCLVCNRGLQALSRRQARERVPPQVALRYRRFRACPQCGRVYWRGSHWEHMRRYLQGGKGRSNP